MSFGHAIAIRIREIRKSKGMTQEELAIKSDMEATVLSRIERGQSVNIQVNTLDRIVQALETDYSTFFSFSDSNDVQTRLIGKLSLLKIDDQKEILKIIEEIIDWKIK
ncbi:MAG: helix-turn-helix transcriptional regulator [Streptococcus orisratti]|uniref:helix-turn-helix domain-containing protein n=1 Tax=Streptococcus orisratti TaxID=114652 RepID=UPI002A90ED5D|nr:helix-turn-helix transcriptional regulator [Streptococcus orisratti]MDY5636072.1 helix-turn-helix transcriptional regulator [Streptococcus orisratti]